MLKENNLEVEAAYNSRAYDRILAGDYRWSAWAGPDKGLKGRCWRGRFGGSHEN